MWNNVEFDHKPDEVDETSSAKYVYVRKNITEQTKDNGGTYWTADENKVPKEDWEQYESILQNSGDITDLQVAIAELAGIISEG